jgi:hypothetical protein
MQFGAIAPVCRSVLNHDRPFVPEIRKTKKQKDGEFEKVLNKTLAEHCQNSIDLKA